MAGDAGSELSKGHLSHVHFVFIAIFAVTLNRTQGRVMRNCLGRFGTYMDALLKKRRICS